jgi:uncharacterized protein
VAEHSGSDAATAVEITGLFIYPVKSCRGIALQEAEIGPRGLLQDREFLLVDEHDIFMTQRKTPDLARISVALENGSISFSTEHARELRLRFSDIEETGNAQPRRTVRIFNDTLVADDVGETAAEWFSDVLQRSCRVVRIGAASRREVPLSQIAEPHRGSMPPQIPFTDAYPTLLASEESLADLNARLPHAIPMNRFRPNIVVRGAAPFAEHTWTSLRRGDVVLGSAAACLRCVVTTTDQRTGLRDGAEPLQTLATYRRSPDGRGVMFGQYVVHPTRGTLRVGDTLFAEA